MTKTKQTTFHINKQNKITGLNTTTKKIIIITRRYKPKNCKWCNQEFTPKTSHQLYCSKKCRKYSDNEHTLQRVRNFRKKYKDILSTLPYTTLGTGNLGQHTTHNPQAKNEWQEETNKIRKELKLIGLKSNTQSYQ